MKTFKVKVSLTIRSDDDRDSIRDAIHESLRESLDDDTLSYSVQDLDEEDDE